MSALLPEPLGPITPTRSPKWISSEKAETRSAIWSERRSSTIRAESLPRMRTAMAWSATGDGGGPAARNRFQRVSIASARLAQDG